MEYIKLLKTPELIDLLAEQTVLYTRMLTSGANHDEFEICRQQISELQHEIGLRKESKTNRKTDDRVNH